jgi:flagellar basal-body rod modification protein FlgD
VTAIDPTAFTAGPDPLAGYRLQPTNKKNGDQFGTDTFLQLLVAQLRYQDPMSPSSGTEFLTQTATFTMVEKLASLDKELQAVSGTQSILAASGMIGRQVSYRAGDRDAHGVVSSVRFGADGPVLRVGGADVPLADVLQVEPAPSGSPGTPTSP